MTLDFAVAQAVMRARQIERALHDDGPWSFRFGGVTYPAVRWIGADRVIFRAHLPEQCWIGEPNPSLDLMCRGDVVGSRRIEVPEDGASAVEWVLALPAQEPARA